MIKIFSQASDDPIVLELDALCGGSLDEHDLHRAFLNNMELTKCSFVKANMRNADLSNSKADKAIFAKANLVMADFQGSSLINTKFNEAICFHSIFNGAILLNADFQDAEVNNAYFRHANLCGANMNCLGLHEASLEDALYDIHTQWPSGFEPDKVGAVFVSTFNS
jgi:uncharacterized protein YjbI with pentapeptide repeats